MKERWAGLVDSVGSYTLANACAGTMYGGVVTVCGLAQGMDFPATVAPFILRGVTLKGIDSVRYPLPQREKARQLLEELIDDAPLTKISTEISLQDAIDSAAKSLNGEIRGRAAARVSA